MRVKTDEKRKEILEAATAVFEERGYQAASMSAISARVGGAKATLYSYFKSKEELFTATITAALEPEAEQVMATLDNDRDDVETVLRAFAKRYLAFISAPEILVLFRTGASGGVDQDLGPILYEQGPRRMLQRIERYLGDRTAEGDLKVRSPSLAALQLKALIECGFLEQQLFNIPATIPVPEVIDAAITMFLAAYQTTRPKGRGTGLPTEPAGV